MNAIEVKDVYKSFKIYFDKGSTLKEKVLFRNRNHHEIHEVLKGVSFNVEKGQVVGLIGENGCGKSTLLKLMTKIIYPDKGSIKVHGKVSSLLELGAGFHPDMSGRENIYTNASIFGLSKKEIDARIESIIDFSELGEFIDNPVRTYSSGMYMRLAFSVAINVDADVLLIDEILAVGDAAFQAKCFNKMQEIKRMGTTIIIVSHDLGSVEKLCDKAIWINNGKKRSEGKTHNIACQYLDYIMNKEPEGQKEVISENEKNIEEVISEEVNNELESNKRWGNRDIVISKVELKNNNVSVTTIKTGESVELNIYFRKNKKIDSFIAGIAINRMDGILVYGTNTKIDGCNIVGHNANEGVIRVKLIDLNVLPGEYYLDVALESTDSKPYDYYCEALRFNVYSTVTDVGLVRIIHEWKLDSIELRKKN